MYPEGVRRPVGAVCRSNKKTRIILDYIKDHINKSSRNCYAKTEVKVSCSNHSQTKRHAIHDIMERLRIKMATRQVRGQYIKVVITYCTI